MGEDSLGSLSGVSLSRLGEDTSMDIACGSFRCMAALFGVGVLTGWVWIRWWTFHFGVSTGNVKMCLYVGSGLSWRHVE